MAVYHRYGIGFPVRAKVRLLLHVVRGFPVGGGCLFRAAVVPSSPLHFGPGFLPPVRCVARACPRASCFGVASGFSRSGTRSCCCVPVPVGPRVSLTHCVAARSSVLRGWGAWGRCSGRPLRLGGPCLFGWWFASSWPPPVPLAEWRQPRDLVGQPFVPAGYTLKLLQRVRC